MTAWILEYDLLGFNPSNCLFFSVPLVSGKACALSRASGWDRANVFPLPTAAEPSEHLVRLVFSAEEGLLSSLRCGNGGPKGVRNLGQDAFCYKVSPTKRPALKQSLHGTPPSQSSNSIRSGTTPKYIWLLPPINPKKDLLGLVIKHKNEPGWRVGEKETTTRDPLLGEGKVDGCLYIGVQIPLSNLS